MKNNVTKLKNANAPDPNDPNDPAWEPVRKAVREKIDQGVITARKLAKESGNSDAALNQFLNGKYTGRNDLIADRLQAWLDTHQRRMEAAREIPDGPGFVFTPTANKITDTLTYAHMADDIVLIYGGAGLGKTEALREYARNNSGVCLSTMTPAHATVATSLREIGKCVGVQPRRDNAALFDAICQGLGDARGLLIIDEAQHLGTKALDQIRSIHDRVGCGIALVGNEQVYGRMTGGTRAGYLDRLFSRIGMRTRITRATANDASALAEAWGLTDSVAVKLIVDIARKPGGLRGVTKALRLAHMLSGGKPIEPKHIRAAWRRLGGD